MEQFLRSRLWNGLQWKFSQSQPVAGEWSGEDFSDVEQAGPLSEQQHSVVSPFQTGEPHITHQWQPDFLFAASLNVKYGFP